VKNLAEIFQFRDVDIRNCRGQLLLKLTILALDSWEIYSLMEIQSPTLYSKPKKVKRRNYIPSKSRL